MMTARNSTSLLMAAAALTLFAASFGMAGSTRAYVDGPIVIGDQVFAGGTVDLVTLGRGNLVAVRVDGRQVALAFRESGAWTDASHSDLVLRRDSRGMYHLVGLQTANATGRQRLDVASVARGLTNLHPAGIAQSEQEVRAAR
jgi:hypothetical protein